jgi:ABC-2 type transport system permease protein
LVENAIGPIVGTMAVLIVCFVVSTVDVPLFVAMKPYLFTSYMNIWGLAVEDPIPWEEISLSSTILLGYSAGFFTITWVIFTRKDILS